MLVDALVVKVRERVIRIFPTRESVLRLLGAVLMEQDDAWTTGHRYFDLHPYRQWRAEREAGQLDTVATRSRQITPLAASSPQEKK